ncbi:hypothetical protein FS837_000961 [Tulasnella sp. UAMH 9824]|nr:hypothetical protein FS837_000961 [Tulasnella sp. UAMH 9824]
MDHQSSPWPIVQPPILSIPEEVTVELFYWSIDEHKPATHLLQLRQVCKKWMLIVDSAPVLWTRITAADGLPNVRIALRKAREALIDIVYPSKGCKISPETFLEGVEHEILHWRSVDIELPVRHMRAVYPGLQTTFIPSLKSIRLYRDPCTWRRPAEIKFFGGAAAPASLAQVTICNVPVALKPLRLASLSSLALRRIPGVSVTELWRIIGESPDLASLVLEELAELQVDMLTPLHPIHLKSMKSLTLKLPVSVTHLLLSNIHPQSLTNLNIACGPADSPIQSCLLTPQIAHLIPSLKSLVFRANIMVLGFQDEEISIEAGGLSLELETAGGISGTGTYACMREAIEWLMESVGPYLATVPTRLHFQAINPYAQDVWLFSSTLRVVELSLYDNQRFANVPTKLLSDLGQPAPPFSQWLFPNLEIIHFDLGDTYHPRLFHTLRGRYGASSTTSGSGANAESPQHPLRPLQEIRFYGGKSFACAPARSVEFLEMVQSKVPNTKLFWQRELVETEEL